LGKNVCLAVGRLAAAAWVGAAALFVVIAVREVTHPSFDSATKDAIVLLRFPAYYACGFLLVPLALLGACFADGPARRQARRAAWCLAAALVIMLADYVAVYRPMSAMITPPGRVRSELFRSYHSVSEWLNATALGLCALAAVLLCWPENRESNGPARQFAGSDAQTSPKSIP
jgi:hypothetical protein